MGSSKDEKPPFRQNPEGSWESREGTAGPNARTPGPGRTLLRGVRKGLVRAARAVEWTLRREGQEGLLGGRAISALLEELTAAQLSETATMMTDLMSRSLPTSQAVALQLPTLFALEDPALLSLYRAIVVVVLGSHKEVGPTIAKVLVERLGSLPPAERARYLSRVLRGAYVDANLALALASQLPELMRGLDDDALDTFLRQGFTLWCENPGKGLSFFRLESRQGLQQVENLRQSLPLSTVLRTLQLYARAHGGPHLRVAGLEEGAAPARGQGRSSYTDGRTIFLPPEVGGYPTAEENFRLFKAMTALEAGRLEFGTFRVKEPGLGTEGEEHEGGAEALLQRLDAMAHPGVARELFALLDTWRVEQRLKGEYPGLRGDLERLAREGLSNRPAPEELEPLAAVLELLAQRLWGGGQRLELAPVAMQDLVHRLEQGTGELALPTATVEDVLRRTREALAILAPLLPQVEHAPKGGKPGADRRHAGPKGGGDSGKSRGQKGHGSGGTGGEGSSRLSLLPHQGRLEVEQVAAAEAAARLEAWRNREEPRRGEADRKPMEETRPPSKAELGGGPSGEAPVGGGPEPEGSPRDVVGAEPGEGSRPLPAGRVEEEGLVSVWQYPEWDWQIDDYKDHWCQVLEERLPEVGGSFSDQVLERSGPVIQRLKRQFQRLRREEYERLRRQLEGDEVDLDAAIEALIDRRSRRPPSERVYVQRVKRIRDVAVAFLLDMSSSTQQLVQPTGKSILDIEKESLLVMAEALEALGDAYAIFGFSGYGRQKVSFYIAKEFGESYGPAVRQRIAGMSGRLENRDGAAIRHASRKLLEHPAKVRLLILLSDGRPLDCGCRQYFDRYAQEDTRMALREARRQHIHPFCITVDRQAQKYLDRMYNQVQYTIIDQVAALPQRLPAIYRRLTT